MLMMMLLFVVVDVSAPVLVAVVVFFSSALLPLSVGGAAGEQRPHRATVRPRPDARRHCSPSTGELTSAVGIEGEGGRTPKSDEMQD